MKKESRAYDYDWNLWTIIENASRTYDGSPKEYACLLEYIPHFNDVLDAIIRYGEPGTLLLKLLADYLKDCLEAHDKGRKTAFTTFCFAAPILYAFDVTPICTEPMTVLATLIHNRGTAEFLDYCCEVGFTETSCSAQRGALGAYLAGLGVQPDFVVCDSPGICDTNANSFAFASAWLDIPFFQLDHAPTLTDERSRDYYRQDFRRLIDFLEEQTGNKLDLDRLREIVGEIRRQDELICQIQEMQVLVPNPVPPIFNLFLYSGNFLMGGKPEYTHLLEVMLRAIETNGACDIYGTPVPAERARGFFSYIDHYTTDLRFWNWMTSRGVSHLGCILSSFWQEDAVYATDPAEAYSMDSSSLDAILDSLADQMARMPMVKSIRGPYDAPRMWFEDTLTMARIYKADFVAYIGTMGCRNTWGMVKLLARDLEKQGIPTLILYADAFDDRVMSWNSITDKLDEFLNVRNIGRQAQRRIMP